MKLDAAFFKEHWYLITMGVLTLGAIIVIIVMFFEKVGVVPPIHQINCKPNQQYITDIMIGGSLSSEGDNCPVGYFVLPTMIPTVVNNLNSGLVNLPLQICYQVASSVCDDTLVITDVKFVDMGTKDAWNEQSDRCPNGYAPALSSLSDSITKVPTPECIGELPTVASPACTTEGVKETGGCPKRGLCLIREPFKTAKNPLKVGDLVVSLQKAASSATCSSGFMSDGVDLHKGCPGSSYKSVFLCRKK